jgi:hypothetical protein
MKDAMRRHAIALALALALTPAYAQQPLQPPLKNWAAPLYWAPTPGELERQRLEQRIAHPDASSSSIAKAAGIFVAPGPMTFIAITPCRVMDTRASQPFTGVFGPPSLAAYVTRQVPMPSSSCNIPSSAGAYSLNITVVPPGAMSFLSAWPAGQPFPSVSTLNDPVSGGVVANAAIVPAGTAGAIQMVAGGATDVIIDINGYYAAPSDADGNTAIGAGALASNTTGFDNTASGAGALQSNTGGNGNAAFGGSALQGNTTGNGNTASGFESLETNSTGSSNTADGSEALISNTTGSNNTATGAGALFANTIGTDNTANGFDALSSNTTGNFNTADGDGALQSNTTGALNAANGSYGLHANTTGSENTASGFSALLINTVGSGNTADGISAMQNNTAGNNNTAQGRGALLNNTTGNTNIAIGFDAALNVAGGNSNNIHIGSPGNSSDSATIKIGTQGTQSSTYVAGISGVSVTGAAVFVNGSGQLGIVPSSRRFKEQITDMGDSSSKLLQLRPVNFFYKPEFDDGSHMLQYGLIAEEVAKVYPEMVVYDGDGQILTVKYQMLAPMLLNEVQKQAAEIRSLKDGLAELRELLGSR